LKATQGFSDLRVQLEGCENRITVSRKDFNDSVKDFNSKLVTFPNNILGGMFGFKEKGYFQAKEGSDKVPEVKF
jgi:LemA protein